ncbi:IGHM protein, partial [Aegotheles bennettii]|nr:IGHM protein [Aegotheles bennettii]
YAATSHLGLPLQDGKSQQPFYCKATHSQGTAIVRVENPGGSPSQTFSVTMHPPSQEDFQGPYRNSTILCRIRSSGRHPSPGDIRWMKNGEPFSKDVITERLLVNGQSRSEVMDSRIIVTEADWNAGDMYTCQVNEEFRNTSKALECG